MKSAGYEYVVIDDCWEGERGADGRITADAQRFPSGIKALADHVHSLGLKLGIYTSIGPLTCQKRPGSHGYEEIDAKTYAEWGVDYVKVDWCSGESYKAKEAYSVFRDALAKAGRPIVYSVCNWGQQNPWEWGREVANLWRTTKDIDAHWGKTELSYAEPVATILSRQAGLAKHSGPGAWNDPDMLEVGNGDLTPAENRAHFAMWCMLAAPLMAGHDVRATPPDLLAILTHKELLAVNQDVLGVQADRVSADEKQRTEVWARPLADGTWAVALLNLHDTETRNISVPLATVAAALGPQHAEGGVPIGSAAAGRRALAAAAAAAATAAGGKKEKKAPAGGKQPAVPPKAEKGAAGTRTRAEAADGEIPVRDLWRGVDLRPLAGAGGRLEASVEPHGVAVLRVGAPSAEAAEAAAAREEVGSPAGDLVMPGLVGGKDAARRWRSDAAAAAAAAALRLLSGRGPARPPPATAETLATGPLEFGSLRGAASAAATQQAAALQQRRRALEGGLFGIFLRYPLFTFVLITQIASCVRRRRERRWRDRFESEV